VKQKIQRFLGILLGLLVITGNSSPSLAQVSEFIRIDFPGAAQTQVWGINGSGQIVGFYNSPSRGFLLDGGNFSTIDFPGATQTYVSGINDSGQMVGGYTVPNFGHSFLLDGGSFSPIDFPGATNTQAWGINDSGQIVGRYSDGTGTHGFLLDGGSFSTIVAPDGTRAVPWGINDAGLIVGSHTNGSLGFLLQGEKFTSFDPSEALLFDLATFATGINDACQIVGFLLDDPGFEPPKIGYQAQGECITLLDPVPDLLNELSSSNPNFDLLAAQGRTVEGIAADGTAKLVLRIPANSSGEQIILTVFNDQVPSVASQTSDEDGALQSFDNSSIQSSITVSTVDTSEGPMAFAIYHAPIDFVRPGLLADEALSERSVTIRVEYVAQGTQADFRIKIVRPPVVLIHGQWEQPMDWDLATTLVNNPLFFIRAVDYALPIQIANSIPAYSQGVLANVRTNALGFDFNANEVLAQITWFIDEFKNAHNPVGIPVAAVQADLVAHSMGGDIARTLPLLSRFLSDDTFSSGSIHKLITIGTPHLGTPLATQLLQGTNSCVRNLLARQGSISFTSVTTTLGVTISGGVFDLQGDGIVGGALSGPLTNIQQSGFKLPVAPIAGVMNQIQLDGIECTFCVASYIRLRCSGDPLADSLTSALWPTIFGQDSDAIVPLSSQLDGLQGSLFNAVHSSGATRLNFGSPHEYQEASGIPNRIVELLNTPVTNSSFSLLPP